ncbi:hypothetical protein D3C81_2304300 [compost metagenome]
MKHLIEAHETVDFLGDVHRQYLIPPAQPAEVIDGDGLLLEEGAEVLRSLVFGAARRSQCAQKSRCVFD